LAFKSPEAERLDLARRMGAQMDLLAAQLQLDVLALPKDARAMAEQAAKDWSAVPGMNDHCLRVMIQTYLKEQNLAKAFELFDKIQQGAEDVVGQIVVQVRQRIESLDPVRDAVELKQYLDNYVRFAEMLHATAETRFKANAAGKPADWLDKQMYSYRQNVACAYEYSDDKERLAKALELYRTLAKQNKQDAVNLRGMARCNRKLTANIEAMNQYNALVAGLEKRSPAWWKAQLERLQFAVQVSASSPEEIKKIALEMKLLQDVDPQMGGLLSEFIRLGLNPQAAP
jgi:tetratricopeptide (TPR) repeat protein